MSDLYPFLLEPEFKERPWGARDLSPIYDRKAEASPIGEVWLTADTCKVANGPLKGRTLQDLCREYGKAFLGENCPDTSRFPLLIKFLFPHEKLSVQVHPDDEGARRIGQPCGKTECWYVLDAKPGAQVGLGLKPSITKQQLAEAIEKKRAEFLLNWVPIHKGELIYVPAGTVHTIGPGSILVETQQNSDTTYRLYDYGRPRELHIEQGLAATKEKTHAGKVKPERAGENEVLVFSRCFAISKHQLGSTSFFAGLNTTPNGGTFSILVCIGGGGVVQADDCPPLTFSRGEVVVVPASCRHFKVTGQWDVEFLDVVLPPAGTLEEPETSLSGFEATAAEP
ncbi:MAG: class I mannose-6-phosphate isomerase [Acidobacteriia bacterium]|nr:class I mannose-6-phosphate isomerase [Terriglobia bacterium]